MENKVICVCGAVHFSCNTERHLKGRKHINYLNDPMKVHIIKERYIRSVTCECGSKYNFINQMWKEAHERSYSHWKNLKHKLDIEKSI